MRHPLVAAALILLALDALAGLGVRLGLVGRPYVLAQERWRELEASDGRARWLVVGDSACNAAVSEEVLSEKLGTPVLNLCSVGDFTLVNSAWMVERYIERWGPPSVVVVAESPRAWAVVTERELVAPAVTLGWSELGRLDPPIRPLSREGLAVLEWRWAPLYAAGEDIAFRLLARPPIDPLPPQPISDREGPVSSENRAGFAILRSLSRRAGFRLVVASIPVNESIVDSATQKAYRAAVRGEVGDGELLDALPRSWPSAMMRDRIHMRRSSQHHFSVVLASALTSAPRRAIH